MYDSGLGAIRDAWLAEGDQRLILGALGQWLNIMGELYGSNAGYIGWSWFVKDYCPRYAIPASRDKLRRLTRAGLVSEVDADLESILEALDEGMEQFLNDVERQDGVRRAVLPIWQVMEPALS